MIVVPDRKLKGERQDRAPDRVDSLYLEWHLAVHRIYIQDLDPATLGRGVLVEVTGDEARHALSVKRLAVSNRVELLNGRGLVASGSIMSVAKRSLVMQVETMETVPPERPEVMVAAPPPKGPRAEAMIEQLSQLGVTRWIPLVTERSVVEPRDKRVVKWRGATTVQSAKQCGRVWVMEIDDPTPLVDCLKRADQPRLLLADAAGGRCRSGLEAGAENRPIMLLVGPEGGFSDVERAIIRTAGATPISLGPHILRIETAAAVGIGVILCEIRAARAAT